MTGPIAAAIEEAARQRKLAKQILEGLLFCSAQALTLEQLQTPLRDIGDLSIELIVQLLREIAEEYTLRDAAIELAEVAGGYLFRTRASLAPFLQKTLGRRTSDRLSPSLLEVLAIIAYRQPVTKPQIEAIRGVDSAYAVTSLLERGLIEVSGKANKPGRPSLFATTRQFLQHFGLRDLSELGSMLPSDLEAAEQGAAEGSSAATTAPAD